MAKKIIFVCVWTVVFAFGSAFVLGFASGVYFYMSSMAGRSEPSPSWIGMAWAFVPMVLGLVGLLLGLFGVLPGTRRKSS